MIRCTKCGTINNEGDIFCAKCASFLEWTGVKVDPAQADSVQPASDSATADSPAGGSLATSDSSPSAPPPPPPGPSVRAEPQLPLAAPAPPPPPGSVAPNLGPPPDTAGAFSSPFGAAPPPEPAPYKFKAPTVDEHTTIAPPPAPPAAASKPVVPRPTDEPPAVKPGAVQPPAVKPTATQPDEPRSRQPTLAPPPPRVTPQQHQSLATEPEIRPGDLICGVCGAGNSPERSFCRRCGNSLAAASVAVEARVPWYRRIFGRKRGQVMVAGDRPQSMGSHGRSAGWFLKRIFVVVLVLAIIAPIAAYFAIPSFKDRINSLIGQGGDSVLLAQHPSNAALDKDVATYWLADQASGNTTVTVKFGQTEDLAALTFNGGATGNDYNLYGRPREVQLSFLGEAKPVSLLLNDTPAPQIICLHGNHQTSTFNIRIVSSYPPQGANQNFVALREVTFTSGSCPPQS